MKLLTDENDNAIFDPQVMSAFWFLNSETNLLTIVPSVGDDFEICGADDDEEVLIPLNDDALGDEDMMKSLGFDVIQEHQRRFSPESGYYYA